jgi:hypothetical protein
VGEVIFFDGSMSRLRRRAGGAVAGAVVLVTMLLEAGPSWAQAVRLDLRIDPAAALFSGDELTDAVGLRGTVSPEPGPGVTEVVVTAPAQGRILIQVGGRTRQLEIKEGTASTDAARLAALLIWDLVRPLPPLTPDRGAAASARLAAPIEETTAATPVSHAATSSGGTFDVSMMASVALRTTDLGPAFAPVGEVQWSPAAARAFALSAAAGFDRAEVTVRGVDGDRTLGLSTVPVRVGVGWGVRAFGIRAGLLARAYFADGLTHDAGVLWGGFVAATAALPLRGPLVPFATAGLDVHAQPVAVSILNQRVLAVHTLAPWIGLGLSWTWGRA